MTRQDPHYRQHRQYSSYYAEQPPRFEEEFARPTRPSRLAQPRSAPPPSRPQVRRPVAPSSAHHEPKRSRGVWLAGGGMLALAALVISPKPALQDAEQKTSENVVCEDVVQSTSVLSRAELSQLLSVAERAPKEDVRAVIDQPYCVLPSVQVREGATSEREAYPLEFNPQTWFIVLYEDGEYAGFDFSFTRE